MDIILTRDLINFANDPVFLDSIFTNFLLHNAETLRYDFQSLRNKLLLYYSVCRIACLVFDEISSIFHLLRNYFNKSIPDIPKDLLDFIW